MPIPVYINSFNRLEWLKAMVPHIQRLHNVGKITIVDNASTYRPLLDWLHNECPVDRILMQHNGGPRGYWGVMNHTEPYYVVTDPDLDISGIPDDTLDVLRHGLDHHTAFNKAGLSLHLDDIPAAYPYREKVWNDERPFWQKRLGFWYDAMVDTTFVMCRTGVPFEYKALRAPAPYQARHLPWYLVPGQIPAEEEWYIKNLPREHKPGLSVSTMHSDNMEKMGIK